MGCLWTLVFFSATPWTRRTEALCFSLLWVFDIGFYKLWMSNNYVGLVFPTFHAAVIQKPIPITCIKDSQALCLRSLSLCVDPVNFWDVWMSGGGCVGGGGKEWVDGTATWDECGRESVAEREIGSKKKVNLCGSSSFLKLYHVWVLDSLAGFLLFVFLPFPDWEIQRWPRVLFSSATPCSPLFPSSSSFFNPSSLIFDCLFLVCYFVVQFLYLYYLVFFLVKFIYYCFYD
jgi:hypothetical protein